MTRPPSDSHRGELAMTYELLLAAHCLPPTAYRLPPATYHLLTSDF